MRPPNGLDYACVQGLQRGSIRRRREDSAPLYNLTLNHHGAAIRLRGSHPTIGGRGVRMKMLSGEALLAIASRLA
jgi:hypothetical protein